MKNIKRCGNFQPIVLLKKIKIPKEFFRTTSTKKTKKSQVNCHSASSKPAQRYSNQIPKIISLVKQGTLEKTSLCVQQDFSVQTSPPSEPMSTETAINESFPSEKVEIENVQMKRADKQIVCSDIEAGNPKVMIGSVGAASPTKLIEINLISIENLNFIKKVKII